MNCDAAQIEATWWSHEHRLRNARPLVPTDLDTTAAQCVASGLRERTFIEPVGAVLGECLEAARQSGLTKFQKRLAVDLLPVQLETVLNEWMALRIQERG